MNLPVDQAAIRCHAPDSAGLDDKTLLPARLHDLSLTEPAVVRAILKGTGSSYTAAASALRGACKLLRAAVNNTVDSVSIQLGEPAGSSAHGAEQAAPSLELSADLGATFPHAAKLSAHLQQASCQVELLHSLAGLPRLCPSLLPRLQHLHLTVLADHVDSDLCLKALHYLLST
jgi:hypothetical protein